MPDRKRTVVIILLLILLLLCTCGCWDMVELEDRGFILGAAVDKTPEGKFSVTYQLALPGKIAGESGGGGGGSEEEPVVNLTTEGETLYEARSKLFTMIDRVLDFEHIQIFLFGEEAVKDGIQEFVDIIARNYQLRRRTKVLVVRGKAEEVLKSKVKTQKSTALYIASLLKNNGKATEQVHASVDLGVVVESIREDIDFILGLAQIEQGEIKISGVGVFKEGKLIGYLYDDILTGTDWLMGEASRKKIIVDKPTAELDKAVFLMSGAKTEVTPIVNGNKVDFKVEIAAEGDLVEIHPANKIIFTGEQFQGIEQALEREIIRQCQESLRVLQGELKTDVLNFNQITMRRKYKFWEQNGERWDELFSQARVDLQVRVHLRRVGLTR